jgi:uncharacterized membrane protein YdfJ with MMPL/SSD domain
LKITYSIIIFLGIVGVLAFVAPELSTVTTNEESEFLPKGSESLKALELAKEKFSSSSGLPAVIVINSQKNLTFEDKEKISKFIDLIDSSEILDRDGQPVIGRIISPIDNPLMEQSMVSSDKTTMQILINMQGAPSDDSFEEAVDRMRDQIIDVFEDSSLSVYVTGPAGIIIDAVKVFKSIDLTVTIATVLLVLVLLLVIYRSPVLAITPLIIIAFTLYATRSIAALLSQNFNLPLNDQVAAIMSVLLFGAGTDFSLFVISRYREELQRMSKVNKWEAMRVTMENVGPAIATSAGTTIVAMLILLFATNGSFVSVGPMLAMAVFVMLLVGLTVIPGVVVLLGKVAFWPINPFETTQKDSRFWKKIADLVSKKGFVVLVTTLIFLLISSSATLLLKPNFSFVDGFPDGTDSKNGYSVILEKFPPGDLAPTKIFMELKSDSLIDQFSDVEMFVQKISEYPGVVRIYGPTRPTGDLPYLSIEEIRNLNSNPNDPAIMQVIDPAMRFLSSDNSMFYLDIVWDSDPYSNKTISKIGDFRFFVKNVSSEIGWDEEKVIVGGETAVRYDTKQATIHDLTVVGPFIILVIWIVLILLLRSLIAPTYLIFSVLLSFGSAFGLSVLFFQYILGHSGVAFDNSMWLFVFLVALGTDYNVYIMSRIKEEVKTKGIIEGTKEAITKTGGVITSAGIILAGTFMVLFTLPLQAIAQLGFGVSLGVLLDTFIVRGLLVPSMVVVVNKWSWWPNPMFRD